MTSFPVWICLLDLNSSHVIDFDMRTLVRVTGKSWVDCARLAKAVFRQNSFLTHEPQVAQLELGGKTKKETYGNTR
jgi:hypothetical protein